MKELKKVRVYNSGINPLSDDEAAEGVKSSMPDKKPETLPTHEISPQKDDTAVAHENELNPRLSSSAVLPAIGSNPAEEFPEQKAQYRILGTAYLNTFFRIFMWRDLVEELIAKRPVFGFDFGKPFRSKSIEILNVAHGEWTRDGWIAVHNSYLEIIYRAGIIGIVLIMTVFLILSKMIRAAIILKSVTAILLCAVLLNWLVAAAFMLVLELPYKAIPFWILFGVAFAYLNEKKAKWKLLKASRYIA